jgi:hypothetical protein
MTIVRVILSIALIGALFLAGLRVYQHLPDDLATRVQGNDPAADSSLTIVMHNELAAASGQSRIELYPIDYAAFEKEYRAHPRPGKTLDDLLGQRMKGVAPVRAELDRNGKAIARLASGAWWLRATIVLNSGETLEWRLPLNIAGRNQSIELSTENAYERAKQF